MYTAKRKIVFKLAEMFCGPGGLAWGAKSAVVSTNKAVALVEPLWANDIDADTCRTYARNIHPDKPERVFCGPIQVLLC